MTNSKNDAIRPFHIYLYGNDRGPIPTSFEATASRLEALPLLYFEPDGSFVWCRDRGEQQIYGMLYDAAGQIQYCEIQGKCSLSTWIELRSAITGELATAGPVIGLQAMRLPEQELQELQSFEKSVWRSTAHRANAS
ncbi:hypothetical protein [Rubripirellula reticaptiva]|uniref:Uncharacterized protein n=1 Tax=Rubripirellula reticaptiva TaxID=2528013 RepID=A0A5C6FDD8_9BACT|nr:hypothetical protein [Rubripirellula reticaptiva]TWU58086.1 hypothetical protein Poly59_09950 [Rubripirellula reticaptiva]